MKLYIFLSLVLLAASVASAAPDYILLGPYNLSFDLGDVPDYEIMLDDPKFSETLEGTPYIEYGGRISDGHEAIGFVLQKLETCPAKVPDPLAVLRYSFASSGFGESSHREIDGCPGAVLLSTDRKLGDIYAALYYPAFADGSMTVLFVSTYPWDEGTLAMLRTIHVGEIFLCPGEDA